MSSQFSLLTSAVAVGIAGVKGGEREHREASEAVKRKSTAQVGGLSLRQCSSCVRVGVAVWSCFFGCEFYSTKGLGRPCCAACHIN